MYIPIGLISRGIDETSNPQRSRTIGLCVIAEKKKNGLIDEIQKFDIYIAVSRHPKKHSLCPKTKKEGRKAKIVSKWSAREFKLNCRSKAKEILN